jgi:3',5'-cyclic AMP phosphodiesterase CpdA
MSLLYILILIILIFLFFRILWLPSRLGSHYFFVYRLSRIHRPYRIKAIKFLIILIVFGAYVALFYTKITYIYTDKTKTKIETVEINLQNQVKVQSLALPKPIREEIEKQIFSGKILFNFPKKMAIGKTERIEVRIAPEASSNIKSQLRGNGIPETENIKIGSFMNLRLISDKFYIEATSNPEQPIADLDLPITNLNFTEWNWYVTPKDSGEHLLLLRITVVIKVPAYKDVAINYPVQEIPITVTSNPIYSTNNFLKQYWLWIGILIAILIAFRWIAKAINKIILIYSKQDRVYPSALYSDTLEKANIEASKLTEEKFQPIYSQMHILHLSDLHITTLDQANLWSNQLAADLYNDLSISHLDALIISGDIANYSTEEEYIAAEQFLHNIRQDFPLNPDKIILVPGNHDLNWKLAKKAYKLTDRDDYEGELFDGHYIEESATVIRVRDEAEYIQRFAHFSSFYETIKQKPYPLNYDQQFTLDHLKQQNLLFLGLNSAWQLDLHYRFRASIHMGAITNALTQIRRNPDYRNCLKIAVWHHPLDGPDPDRITDQGFLEQLAVNGFRFFLHGHIHKAETSLYRYDMSSNGRKLDRICAGTFGAPVRERVPGYPLQYNLLKIEDNQLTVYTRRREELNGAWKPDARWGQGAGKTPLDYYEISLS